jgi:oligogalacturonide lyase
VRSTDWLNHLLFSPTDPDLLMFCHEGPWHKVDRIWTVHVDGSGLTKIHTQTMNMEIAGHEFWSPDGKTIWYDLQTPRGEVFWLAGYEIATGHRRWYAVDRNEWSVHYNVSPDQTLFAGDGGDSEMVAHAPDGKWLYLFHPRAIPDVAGIHAADASALITPGVFDSVRLADMSRHDYRLEPNVHFTPDGKWLVFRSNMEGKSGVYAVEIAGPEARK